MMNIMNIADKTFNNLQTKRGCLKSETAFFMAKYPIT